MSILALSEDERPLSPRELLLVSLAAKGLTDKEIAGHISIGVPTIKTYWQRIRQKLGAANRAQCVARYLTLDKPHETDQGFVAAIDSTDTWPTEEPFAIPVQRDSGEVSPLMSEAEAAAWLGTNYDGLRNLCDQGRLARHEKTNSYLRSQVSDLARQIVMEIGRPSLNIECL